MFSEILALTLFAAVAPEVHEKCLNATDFSGCVKMHERPEPSPDDVRAWERPDGAIVVFDPKSVSSMEVRGETGRYIRYSYRLRTWDPGFAGVRTPIVSSTSFSGNTAYTTVSGGQLIGARAAGPSAKYWTVECDCKDYTANWSGDFSGWIRVKDQQASWAKEALSIMNEFCPKLTEKKPV